MESLKKKIDILRTDPVAFPDDQAEEQSRFMRVAYYFLAGVSLVLTILNLYFSYTSMMILTLLLSVGFFLCALLSRHKSLSIYSELFVSLMLMIIFSIFLIGGRNEGFAALWILLVPTISMLLLRFSVAIILSAYFQLLLIVAFYTSLRSRFADYYTQTFMTRYPVLYCAVFVLAIFFSINLHYSQRLVQLKTYSDSLTGSGNRTFYDCVKNDLYDKTANLGIISLDVNKLKYTNDHFGHIAGDRLIVAASDCIKKAFPNNLMMARVGGDEFVVCVDADKVDVSAGINRMNQLTKEWSATSEYPLSVSSGVAFKSESGHSDFESLYIFADVRMYESKETYYRKQA